MTTTVPTEPRFAAVRSGTAMRLSVLGVITVAVALAWPAGAHASTATFSYTGLEQTYVVPAGVSSIGLAAASAPGSAPSTAGGTGGANTADYGTLAVVPGETLYLEVGTVGYQGAVFPGEGADGGFDGLGNLTGGNGGGATEVRTCSLDANCGGAYLLMEAGGGGGGGGTDGASVGGAGGNRDGPVTSVPGGTVAGGANGKDGTGGGGSGALISPGSGGGGSSGDGTEDGGNGNGSFGGAGGQGVGVGAGAGGGGGGGYFGGGGGAGGTGGGGAGGGAGSSFISAKVSQPSFLSSGHDAAQVNVFPGPADTTAPTLTIGQPVANATYSQNELVVTRYSCRDTGGSGLKSCAGPVASGHSLDTRAPGTHSFTVTASDRVGNHAAKTVSYTVKATPGPRITKQRLTNVRFRVAGGSTTGSAKGRRAPLGTSFRFTLSAPAGIRIVIARSLSGLKKGRACVTPTPKLRRSHAKHCTRILTVGTLTRSSEPAGADGVAFSGRIARRALKPHSYTGTLTATNTHGHSVPVTLKFSVVR